MSDYSKILVTGGAGFIGSHIVDRLMQEGFEVVVLDSLFAGKMENVRRHLKKKNFRLIKEDIRYPRVVKAALKGVDAVFNEAALLGVDFSLKNPLVTEEINVMGTLSMLQGCVKAGVKRFIHASSTAVYGEPESTPIREDHPLRPISPYGASKLAAEHYCGIFHAAFGLETVILRYFNVYGSRQKSEQYSGAISSFTDKIIKGEPPVIFGDGEQTRDFIHVEDVVEANMRALESEKAVGEVFNVATGKPTTINKLADTLLKLCGRRNLEPIYVEPRPGDIRRSYADTSKSEDVLAFKAKIGLREGLTRILGRGERNA
ncbi:MAG: SDR family NAD(P)-dependent oxidoreductase [Candidatus Geothermarchaeales archaeon]